MERVPSIRHSSINTFSQNWAFEKLRCPGYMTECKHLVLQEQKYMFYKLLIKQGKWKEDNFMKFKKPTPNMQSKHTGIVGRSESSSKKPDSVPGSTSKYCLYF